MTRSVFRLFSVAYIAGIFLLADSSVVSDLAPFNPYSLLHIPLYGILTFLLVFSVLPYSTHLTHSTNSTNLNHSTNSTDSTYSTHSDNSTHLTYSTYSTRFLIVGLVATMVGVADEIHQAYVPSRNASVADVFLDMVGIALCLFVVKRLG
jgi:VanZ family protein